MDHTHRLAWAAGFIDGEGCIGVQLSARKAVGRRDHFQVFLDIAQVRPAPLFEIQSMFGGTVYRRRNWHGEIHCWRLYGEKAGVVLRAVLPYLIAKRRQADLVLEYLATFPPLAPGQKKRSYVRVTEELYARRCAIYAELVVWSRRRPVRAERLSEGAPVSVAVLGDAIVRTHGNENRESAAEMPAPLRIVSK